MLLRGYFILQRLGLRILVFVWPDKKSFLKNYLIFDHTSRQDIIAQSAVPLFKGLHPKNIYNFRAEFFLSYLQKTDKVVDIACGTGAILSRISGAIDSGIGIDYSDTNLTLCNQYSKKDNIRFIKGDIMSFDFAALKRESGYTVALYSHIFEHIADVPELLRRVAAVKIMVCVPSRENWLSSLKIHLGLPYFSDPGHRREYTRQILSSEITAAGYALEYLGFNAEGELVCVACKD
jgi:SAM-dependent methyltransferase